MFAALPQFLSRAIDNPASFVMSCLAVAGAFLAGYVLGGILVYALDRWAFSQKAPDALKKASRILAGLILAIIVALWVFGSGSGGGWLGGGADGSGKGSPDADANSKEKGDKAGPPVTQPTPKTPPKIDLPNKSPGVRPDDLQMTVTFLGGDAVPSGDDRFYLIDEDREHRKTLKQVLDEMERRKKQGEPRQLFLLVQYPTDPKLAAVPDSRTVKDVTEAAERMGVKVVQ